MKSRIKAAVKWMFTSFTLYYIIAYITVGASDSWHYWPTIYVGIVVVCTTSFLAVTEIINFIEESNDERVEDKIEGDE